MNTDETNATPSASLPRHHEDHPEVVSRNARYGLILFVVYVLLYGGFMGLTAFAPHVMGETPWAGINLAILYGFGLIVAALALALIYMVLCRAGKR